MSTQCIRCGKERVFLKRWIDKTNDRANAITRELYVCPDKECQKIVDQKFEEAKQKKLELLNRKNEGKTNPA